MLNRQIVLVRDGFDESERRLHYERDRIAAELEFGRYLVSKNPQEAQRWLRLLAEAEASVARALGSGAVTEVRSAVRDAERILEPLHKAAKAYSVFCVGHAHVDMNWMWSWPETVSTTIDSFTTVLRLMEEFPDFKFSQSQASVYRIVEELRPDLLAAIRKRVAEGRWEVTATHWVEADKNLAGGEALCRHLLYTRDYVQRLFGLSPEQVTIDWEPDTFGHAATVPAYLVRGGVKYLYLHRPGAHLSDGRPELFHWQAPDGSRVLVRNDMYNGYNGVVGPQVVRESLIPVAEEAGLSFTMYVYGVGDHGGGPTRRDLARIVDMNSWPLFPNFVFSSAQAFFDRAANEAKALPVLDHELNFEFSGCYTTQSLIKRSNRFAEKRLVEAETASVIALRLTRRSPLEEYPHAQLRRAWQRTLFGHFHDILPGSGVRDTRTFAHGAYQQTVAATGAVETWALRSIAEQINTLAGGSQPADSASDPGYDLSRAFGAGAGMASADGRVSGYALSSEQAAVVLFNLLPSERSEIAEVVVWDSGRRGNSEAGERLAFEVTAPDGRTVAAQVIERGEHWGHEYHRIAFPALVPGIGYARYLVREFREAFDRRADGNGARGEEGAAAGVLTGLKNICSYASYERSPEGLENEILRVEIDPNLGGIRRLLHKPSGTAVIEAADRPRALLSFALERARPMSAWQIEHAGPSEAPALLSLTRETDGPFVGRLSARYRIRQSELAVVYELRAGDPALRLHISGTWVERGGPEVGTPVLSLELPFAFAGGVPRYEIPFGSAERRMEHGEEVPALRWASVVSGDRRIGCALLNDSKHGHSFLDGVLRLTLIRSAYSPDPLPEVGEHEMHCALVCHDGQAGADEITQMAQAFEQELAVVNTGNHAGSLPPAGRFVAIDSGSSVLYALKKAEEGEEIIARFVNPTDKKTRVRLQLDPAVGRVLGAVETDLLEREIATKNVSVRDGTVSLTMDANAISTLRLSVSG